jgi:phospholipid/cholesterol/gamma-HCH transport system substrate-binding protein
MPNPKKRTEVFVGLFLLIGLSLLGGLIMQFGKFKDRMTGHYGLTVVFDDASGVIKGSEVRMGGARIGQVARLPELNEAVRVEVDLSIAEAIRIPVGATFQINSATLLGDKLIVIIPPADRSAGFIKPESRLEGAGPTGLDAIQNNAEAVVKDVLRIVKDAEATLAKVDLAVDGIKTASEQLGEASGKINSSILADKNLARFDRSLKNLEEITGQWKSAGGKLEPTLVDAREAIHTIQKVAEDAGKFLTSADETVSGLKPAFTNLPRAIEDFSMTTRKAGKALDRMEKGEGLLGALASDNAVALDAKAFMRNLRQYGILLYRNPPPQGSDKSRLPIGGPRR